MTIQTLPEGSLILHNGQSYTLQRPTTVQESQGSVSAIASALGSLGRGKTSEAKKLASAANGKKGKRPKMVKSI